MELRYCRVIAHDPARPWNGIRSRSNGSRGAGKRFRMGSEELTGVGFPGPATAIYAEESDAATVVLARVHYAPNESGTSRAYGDTTIGTTGAQCSACS